MDAAGWDERYAASELVWSAEPNRFVAEVCADLSPGRALDLAAGEGRNAIWLAQRGWTVTAGDFSQVGLDKGRRLAEHAGVADRVAWVLADATSTDWPDDHDLVVVAYLQLVEAERREAVLRAFAALQPGGRFVWVAHDSSNLTEGTGGPQDPSVLMTAEDVLIDLTGEPFDVDPRRARRRAPSATPRRTTAWSSSSATDRIGIVLHLGPCWTRVVAGRGRLATWADIAAIRRSRGAAVQVAAWQLVLPRGDRPVEGRRAGPSPQAGQAGHSACRCVGRCRIVLCWTTFPRRSPGSCSRSSPTIRRCCCPHETIYQSLYV